MKQSSPRRKAAQATQVSRDARLCHLSKRETHVSTSLNSLHLRRTSQVFLKNRRRTSPRPNLQNLLFSRKATAKFTLEIEAVTSLQSVRFPANKVLPKLYREL